MSLPRSSTSKRIFSSSSDFTVEEVLADRVVVGAIDVDVDVDAIEVVEIDVVEVVFVDAVVVVVGIIVLSFHLHPLKTLNAPRSVWQLHVLF